MRRPRDSCLRWCLEVGSRLTVRVICVSGVNAVNAVNAVNVVNVVNVSAPRQFSKPLPRYAYVYMTLFGIVTPVRLVQPANALTPMLVTGRPAILLGMVTTAPEQLYPVMVMVPLYVV